MNNNKHTHPQKTQLYVSKCQGMQSRDSCKNKLQHDATAYRKNKSAGARLGLFRFCKFFAYFFQQIHYSLFRNHLITEQQHDFSVVGKQWLI